MNILQEIFLLYHNSLTTFFDAWYLSDVFFAQFLDCFLFLTYFGMVFFIAFVPIFLVLKNLFCLITHSLSKGAHINVK